MSLFTVKKLALVSAAVLGLTYSPVTAQAQAVNNQDFSVGIAASSAIVVTPGDNLDFSKWLIRVRNGETVTLTLPSTGTTITGAATGSATSTVQSLISGDVTDTGVNGTVLVTVPAGSINTVLQMTLGNLDDFDDAGLSLTKVTYTTATQTGDNELELNGTANPVTVLVGGDEEVVTFGAVISATASPDDDTHIASFEVSFAY